MITPGREAPETLRPYLDTVLVDTLHPDGGATATLELVWRAAFRPPRRMRDAELVVTERDVP